MGEKQAVQAGVLLLEESDEADHPLEHPITLKPGRTLVTQGAHDSKGELRDHRLGRLRFAAFVRELSAMHAARGLGAIQKAKKAAAGRFPQWGGPQKLHRRFAPVS